MNPTKNYTRTTLLIACFCLLAFQTFAQRTRQASHAYKQSTVLLMNATGCYDVTANPLAKCIELMPYDILPYETPLNAGGDVTMCNSEALELNGSGPSSYKTLWTTAGDGTFDDPTQLHTTYHPGDYDKVMGGVVLTLVALPHAGLDMAPVFDEMILNLQACISQDDKDEDY